MTNSHNRATQKEGRNSERNNASPNHQQKNASQNGGNNGRKVTFFNDNNKGNNSSNNSNNSNNNKGYYAQKHSSSAPQQYFSTSPKDIVSPSNHVKNRNHHQQRNHHNGSPHGLTGRSPPRSPISFASPAGVSTTTPNLHFAGSKYFDAPSPNALPRPPCHWHTSSSTSHTTAPPVTSTKAMLQTVESATSKRRLFPNDTSNKKCSLMAAEAASKNLCSDIFSHNLKLLLNVQA